MTEIKQKPPYYNSLDLNLGTSIKVKAICDVGYVDEVNRQIIRTQLDSHINYIVVGVQKKAVGKYVSGRVYGFGEYEPPSLKVDNYIWFYLGRTAINEKAHLIHPNDIVMQENK